MSPRVRFHTLASVLPLDQSSKPYFIYLNGTEKTEQTACNAIKHIAVQGSTHSNVSCSYIRQVVAITIDDGWHPESASYFLVMFALHPEQVGHFCPANLNARV